ncbi:hypothetical protein BOTNAR_0170g00100 [Botryotinia narcissicola]|uniref:Uncharacterized protein n=1 Tax=Botryotinia narcissicola TaxID=278944 RepID=A0A4Z1IEL4_9HELO|nr:hypothetical protein BOTNAR_0170g00100 [Botryotinia narcissicola]
MYSQVLGESHNGAPIPRIHLADYGTLISQVLISPMLEEKDWETRSLEDRVHPLEEPTNFNLMRIEILTQYKAKSPNGTTTITTFDNDNDYLDSSNKPNSQATQR